MVEIARGLNLEDWTELLHFHDKTSIDVELLLIDEERKWFLEMETVPNEDAVKMVDMTTKDLKYYINLVDKAAAVLRGLTPIFERSSMEGKML